MNVELGNILAAEVGKVTSIRSQCRLCIAAFKHVSSSSDKNSVFSARFAMKQNWFTLSNHHSNSGHSEWGNLGVPFVGSVGYGARCQACSS